MAKILVVDDRAVNREFLVTLLGYDNHQLVEAEDGADALVKTRAERPDLIITDILMPTMNGLEFVNRLRVEEPIAQTPVIFYTATYLLREAQVLARACGVSHVLAKPCDPETILTAVRTALGDAPSAPPPLLLKEGEEGSPDLIVAELLKRGKDLQAVTMQLADLIELGLELCGNRDPQELLQRFCLASRRIIGAHYALVGILDEGGQSFRHFVTDGFPSATGAFPSPGVHWLELLLQTPIPTQGRIASTDLPALGLPIASTTDLTFFLGGPIRSSGEIYGCLCFVDKLGAEGFNEEEQRLVQTLAAQISVAYENARLYEELNGYTSKLQQEVLERRRVTEALQVREQDYRSIVENVPDVIWRADADGNINFISPNVERVFGYTAEEVYALGKKFWPGRIHPEDRERVIRAYKLLFSQDQKFDEEYRVQRQDGRWIWAHDRAIRSYIKDGKRVADGIFTDLTEWRSLQEQFQQAQKMESVGRLAGGIAHDFNNLVTIITGYSQVVQDRLGEAHPLQSKVSEIRKAGERAASLTRQLLAFSRRQVLQPQVLDLNEVVAGMKSMLAPLVGEHIELTCIRKEGVGHVKADRGQLEQVIMNLAVNARDAMPQSGKLIIEVANADLDEGYARQHVAVSPGHYVMLAVSDTGCGMDAETKRQIFEPFFTTKEQGKGTGLGLSMVYGIAKQSGGNIWVYSEPGKGSSFKVYIPRVQEAPAVAQPVQTPAQQSRGSETVLVVEDEPALREFIVEVLKDRGYEVLEAEGPKHALSIATNHPKPIQLLLTDMIMPEMGGRELARQLTKLHPETTVLYMSGYTDDMIAQQGLLEAGSAFLQKPFPPKQLTAKVRDVLDRSRKADRTAMPA